MRALDDAAYERIAQELLEKFSDSLTRADVTDAVAQARAELEPQSRHPEFLSILVTKVATNALRGVHAGASSVMREKGIDSEMGARIDGIAGKRRLVWDVRDPDGQPLPVVRTIRDDIERRVRGLLADLGLQPARPA